MDSVRDRCLTSAMPANQKKVRVSMERLMPEATNVKRYGDGAGAGTVVAGNGQLPSYGGQFGTASSGGG